MMSEKIRIGWARRDITPAGKVSLYGQFFLRISEYALDPLTTTALALENESGAQQAIIISIDAVKVADSILAECRKMMEKELPEFASENLFISATHTHTAPKHGFGGFMEMVDLPDDVITAEEYDNLLIAGIVQAAIDAWKSRKLGAVAWGRGLAVIGFNRRVSYFNGETRMYGNTGEAGFSHIEGGEDHSMEILATYDENHKLTGMILNVPCPAQCTERGYFVSADFWHETREKIFSKYGDDIFILPQCSAAGDLSPRTMINRPADMRMMELKGYGDEFKYENKYDVARRCDIADRISAVVDEVLPLIAKDIRDSVTFLHRVDNIELERRMASRSDLDFASEQIGEWQQRVKLYEKNGMTSPEYTASLQRVEFYKRIVDIYNAQQRGEELVMPVELHTLRIGDIAMCTNRFEYYLDYGLRIKARSKALQIFIVQLAGEGAYLPTTRSIAGGNYGACPASSPVAEKGGQAIAEHHVAAINEMFTTSEA